MLVKRGNKIWPITQQNTTRLTTIAWWGQFTLIITFKKWNRNLSPVTYKGVPKQLVLRINKETHNTKSYNHVKKLSQ